MVLSSPAQLVAPVLVARGTLSITTTEIYFEVDEDDPAFKRADPKVNTLTHTHKCGGCKCISSPGCINARYSALCCVIIIVAVESAALYCVCVCVSAQRVYLPCCTCPMQHPLFNKSPEFTVNRALTLLSCTRFFSLYI